MHMNDFFDFTPDPKVLIALTHTPMLPLDALCELIDNAIDGFASAKIQGRPIETPLIEINLPTRRDIANGTGALRVIDNGPGMTPETAEKAIKAGFSGNNPYDSLGLFGMGFNISTGKIGRVTRFRTARHEDTYCTDTRIDLEEINASKDYRLPVSKTEKPDGFMNGTIIEISHWWPEGNPNKGFISKLIQYGIPKIREEIGRRYATILRSKVIQIIINGDRCEPFEHCVWGDTRFVDRKIGQVPAVFRIDQVIGNQRRCGNCTALIPLGDTECPSCSSSTIRTIEERIKGWIGIQRFDDETEFGIDLIRNGRAIRVSEKNAFFEFVDDLKRVTKDYPIDSQYGRMIGEVSLDFVPVDFLKQDFQRSSDEWQRAMRFLRGESSLQPKQPGADSNDSIVFKLYQGYRRVRTFGRADMYMGYWDSESNSAKRITRDVEKEYYEKFKQRIPGYFDDAEWWKLVEQADQKPVTALSECPACGSQTLKESDVCAVCGHILKSKICLSEDCGSEIPLTAQACPVCGASQIPQIQTPWICDVCSNRNRAQLTLCESCGRAKGTPNPLSSDYLRTVSHKSDDLSLKNFSIALADGSASSPLDVEVFITSEPLMSMVDDINIPVIAVKDMGHIELFVDKMHRVFRTCSVRPEEMIAAEVAMFIHDTNRALNGNKAHNLSNLTWTILEKGWLDSIEENPDKISTEIKTFIEHTKARLSEILSDDADELFGEMTPEQQREMAGNIINAGIDIAHLGDMRQSGQYMYHVPASFIMNLLERIPQKLFNGGIWGVTYASAPSALLSEEVTKYTQQRIQKSYANCLDDLIMFSTHKPIDSLSLQRARLSLTFLQKKWVV